MQETNYWKERLNNLNDIRNFRQYIREFFSNNGEATNIIIMYDKLHNDNIAFKTINSIDLQISRNLFNEYEIGFLRHLAYHCGDKNIIGITDIANDKFIHEIFDGSYNKKTETRLSDAIGNLEVLVDLVNDIDTMISNLNRISDKVSYVSYETFTIKYLKKMISEIIDTYFSINSVINGDNTKTKQEYTLFM